jgi:hypothetical protein
MDEPRDPLPSLTSSGIAAAWAALRAGGDWPDPGQGIDAAGAQLVAAHLRAGRAVPGAVTDAPALRHLWATLGLDAALPLPEGAA